MGLRVETTWSPGFLVESLRRALESMSNSNRLRSPQVTGVYCKDTWGNGQAGPRPALSRGQHQTVAAGPAPSALAPALLPADYLLPASHLPSVSCPVVPACPQGGPGFSVLLSASPQVPSQSLRGGGRTHWAWGDWGPSKRTSWAAGWPQGDSVGSRTNLTSSICGQGGWWCHKVQSMVTCGRGVPGGCPLEIWACA